MPIAFAFDDTGGPNPRHPRSGDRSARADLASVQPRIGKLDRRSRNHAHSLQLSRMVGAAVGKTHCGAVPFLLMPEGVCAATGKSNLIEPKEES